MTRHRADIPLALVGYTDRLSAAPGDTIRFMANWLTPIYRADLVRFFSAPAICFCACLSWKGFHNTASRVTENVLRRFIREVPRT